MFGFGIPGGLCSVASHYIVPLTFVCTQGEERPVENGGCRELLTYLLVGAELWGVSFIAAMSGDVVQRGVAA